MTCRCDAHLLHVRRPLRKRTESVRDKVGLRAARHLNYCWYTVNLFLGAKRPLQITFICPRYCPISQLVYRVQGFGAGASWPRPFLSELESEPEPKSCRLRNPDRDYSPSDHICFINHFTWMNWATNIIRPRTESNCVNLKSNHVNC